MLSAAVVVASITAVWLSGSVAQAAPGAGQGGPKAALMAAAKAPQATALVGACAPLDATVALMGNLPPELWELTGIPAAWVDANAFGGLARLGLDPGGAATVAGAPGVLTFALPTSGQNIDEKAILDSLLAKGWQRGEGRMWTLNAGDGAWEAWSADGSLRAVRTSSRGAEPASPGADLSALAAGFQDHPGCIVAAADLSRAGNGRASKIPVNSVAIQLPFNDEPLRVRAATERSYGQTLARPTGLPMMGSGVEPMVVVAVNVRPIDALLAMIQGTRFADQPAAKQLMDLEKSRRKLDIGPGLTLALYETNMAHWTAVMPMVKGKKGRPAPVSRIRKALDAVGEGAALQIDFEDGGRFVVRGEERVIHGQITRGRVVMGTDPADVLAAARGEGRPWLPAAIATEVAKWPIAVATPAERTLIPGTPPIQAFAALSAENKVVDAALSIKSGGMLSGPMTVGVLAGVAVPNFAEMQRRARIGEVARVTSALHDRALAGGPAPESLPPTPRGAEGLTSRPVPWPSVTVDWLGDYTPDGAVRGSYSVAFDGAGGFVIDAFIDVDGDGEASHWRRERQGKLQRLTAEDVW